VSATYRSSSSSSRRRGGGGGGRGGKGGRKGSSTEREANKVDQKPSIRGRGERNEGIPFLLPLLPPFLLLLLLPTTTANSDPPSVLLVLVKAQGKRSAGDTTSSLELRDEVFRAT
jgi:hypothetical protein